MKKPTIILHITYTPFILHLATLTIANPNEETYNTTYHVYPNNTLPLATLTIANPNEETL